MQCEGGGSADAARAALRLSGRAAGEGEGGGEASSGGSRWGSSSSEMNQHQCLRQPECRVLRRPSTRHVSTGGSALIPCHTHGFRFRG